MTYFPSKSYADAGAYADDYFARLAEAAATVDRRALAAAGDLLAERAKAGAMIFACGNGGSAAIANHLTCDHMKGIRSDTGLRPRVHSLSATAELLTAITNDIGPEQMFSYQLSSLASEGDVLIAISSSGNSPNILHVLTEAKQLGVSTIVMTGFSGGAAMALADVSLHVSADNYGLIEDMHHSLMHILAQHLRHAHLTDAMSLGSLKF